MSLETYSFSIYYTSLWQNLCEDTRLQLELIYRTLSYVRALNVADVQP